MWYLGNYGNELKITKKQARSASHQGPCDADVFALSKEPAIARQLAKLDPEKLRRELKEYGAWNEAELLNHTDNLQRILWIACGDITEQIHA